MSFVHFHLLLNHFPIVGSVLGTLLLFVTLRRRSDDLGKAALALFALLGAVSIFVFFTGEPAEDSIEHVAGFSQALVGRHEEAALAATLVMGFLAVVALVELAMFRKRPLARWVVPSTLVLALGATGFMGYASNLGGQVRHTEIRAGAVVPGQEGSIPAATADDR